MSNSHADCFALVTARGGSKGLPRKNILPLAGKPVIAWTIEAALRSKKVQRVILSTDDSEIAAIGKEYGAEVPFLRPAELAADNTPHIEVLEHALQWLKKSEGYLPEYLFTLQPTSPLRTAEDIDGMVTMALSREADAVVAVTEASSHPYLVRKIDDDGRLIPFIPCDLPYLRRQDLPPAFVINGAGFLNRVSSLLTERSVYPDDCHGYVMPVERSFQIDSRTDYKLMELIIQNSLSAT